MNLKISNISNMINNNLFNNFGKERFKIDELLSLHTTIKIGGPADLYFEAYTKDELRNIFQLCQKNNIPYFLLGGGSNILVSDKGFRGLVIRNKLNKISIVGAKGRINSQTKGIENILIQTGSGSLLNKVVRFAIDESLEGLEYFLGLPGTIGGAVWNNAHNMRHKKFIGDLIYQAEILDDNYQFKCVNKDYFHFNYDSNIIQHSKEVVLSVVFNLKKGKKEDIWKRGMEEVNYRKNTQPTLPSYGCTFKNISQSSGFLLEMAGLKGLKIGDAQISDQHANFIINLGNAKASDVIQLINLAKQKVKAKFGVNLKEEIMYLGEF